MPGTTDRRATVVVAGADRWSAQDLAERIERYFADAYEVLSAATRGEAEQVLEGAASAGRRVAAVVAAEDLSDGSGSDLLQETGAVPPAGRLLLSDSGARAGGEGLDGIQVLPARPDEDELWPRLERMLYDTTPEGERRVVVQGDRRAAAVYRVVRFLLLNHVTFTVEGTPTAEVEVAVEIDGQWLLNPHLITLAKALDLTRYSGGSDFDVVVVGGGPAGLTAAINHAGLFGHKVLIIENEAPGGAAGTAVNVIDNHFGFPRGIVAGELAQRGLQQALLKKVQWLPAARAQELSTLEERAAGDGQPPLRRLQLTARTDDGQKVEVNAAAVVVACGAAARRQGGKHETDYENQGVYYMALPADAEQVSEGDQIVVVGAGDTAGRAALMFAAKAAKVTLLVRRTLEDSTMLPSLVRAIKESAIRVRSNTEITEYLGTEGRLTAVRVKTGKGTDTLPVNAVYVLIGADPDTSWLEGVGVELKKRYVVTGTDVSGTVRPAYATSVPGVFAAGDVRYRGVRRIAMAAGEGAAAALAVHNYFTGRPEVLRADGGTANAALGAYYA
ncbi:FAD-dependent oxidoreductase [Streptomyces rubradiris]|uniref:Fused response regulator/thioredoxin-disulfide reductase n=1 Tax=Streptomyces rubradiris TaxID=285531 RepID=A0ABQ3RID5_STRRR|nr:FAD-dependent oxidoreductase [Streptomyces rubradiris]GHH21500.1 fused response regulator/thioredoxin-disulfide reductase [Streptomyces rubradiris]GHI55575.1 fused response regulator/thioredoxin-disulfide reductase [Streptomyces rubradiris]